MELLMVMGDVADFAGVTKGGDVVNVTVTDMGDPGAGPGDLILIEALGPEIHGVWGGVVQGNITIH